MDPLIHAIQSFEINKKRFILQKDFTYEELDFLDLILSKLSVKKSSNEISGNFTKDEIKKTLRILLKDTGGEEFSDKDFRCMHKDQSAKIITAFYLAESSIRSYYKKLFDELNKIQKEAEQEFINLRGYKVKYYEPKISLPENESILFFLFKGNLIEAKNAKASIPRKKILDIYYLLRVSELNELIAGNDGMKKRNTNV